MPHNSARLFLVACVFAVILLIVGQTAALPRTHQQFRFTKRSAPGDEPEVTAEKRAAYKRYYTTRFGKRSSMLDGSAETYLDGANDVEQWSPVSPRTFEGYDEFGSPIICAYLGRRSLFSCVQTPS